ncbi:MAG TPA: protoporphyrinogen oxidase [Micromonosporaceae bacterium]|nr:protoporphyrinogen oxidase [Micromonosporaceae bacterium]
MRRHVAIVGGGIAGLSAALALNDALGDDVTLTVVEQSDRLGGKLRTGAVGGRLVETGAETFLVREADDPNGAPSAAVELVGRVGLGGSLRYPATLAASMYAAGEFRSIPAGTLMGVPADVSSWPGIGGAARAIDTDHDDGRPILAVGDDVAVGALVRRRYGDAVVDDLVDPLLGGVYAGRADDLSVAVTMPGLAAACRTERTLQAAVQATLARRVAAPSDGGPILGGGLAGEPGGEPGGGPALGGMASGELASGAGGSGFAAGVGATLARAFASGGDIATNGGVAIPGPSGDNRAAMPAFATIDGGLSRLIAAIDKALPSATMVLGRPVRNVARSNGGWRVMHGSTTDAHALDVDAVVLAVPSHPAARLLAPIAPASAEAVGMLDYASIALVTLVLPAHALDDSPLAGRSGALVPATAGHPIKAVTVFSTKWVNQPDGAVLLRASLGRYGDEQVLQTSDDGLIDLVRTDLGELLGGPLADPRHAAVTRWGGALPQYAPGHLDRVRIARDALPSTIVLAGAAYDGVGIPACIRSGWRAAAQLIEVLQS